MESAEHKHLISPVETPKEELPIVESDEISYNAESMPLVSSVERKPITADDILGVFKQLKELPKREGLSEIRIMQNDFVKKGEPILMMHPKDFEKMKKDVAFGD